VGRGILPIARRRVGGTSGRRGGGVFSSAKGVEKLDHPPQSVEVEYVCGTGRRGQRRWISRGLGCVDGNGRVTAVGQPNDDIGMLTVAEADDRQLLSAEGMMGMGNGHESRRRLGQRGSALRRSRP
jgi:hypothetical protein